MNIFDRNTSGRERQRGQGLVEFTLVAPIILMILAGIVEVALVANDSLTLGYGSREGARAASALGSGGAVGCADGDDPADVDATVVAGVQRILGSPGSNVALSDVEELRIFKATPSGARIDSAVNRWRYAGEDAGYALGPGEDAKRLDFYPVASLWPACQRLYSPASPDSIGVEIVYRRNLQSPAALLLRAVGGPDMARLTLSETTVMALNPSY